MNFSKLGLSAELQRAIREQGYQTATPIQREAIPAVLDGHDILAGAQTGTGKTAGFALPILQRLLDTDPAGRQRRIRVLVLAPTRELAVQVEESFRAYGRHLPFRSTAIFGGVNIDRQISTLRRGVDIVVATPGRLLDHMERRTVDLRGVEMLVLDEADRMLDMGFIRDIRRILKGLPAERQSMLFSATFSNEIRQLADNFLTRPREIQVAPRNAAAESVEQVAHPVDRTRKRELLSQLIGTGDWRQVLVFTRTKHGANRLSKQLSGDGHASTAIHGNKTQAARTRALADFKAGRVRVLVATDIAARGLDIERLPYVVNFDMPHVPEDYVHRIGRTGRAGEDGMAVSLVSTDERGLLSGIERLLKRDIERVVVPGFEPNGSPAAEPVRSRGDRNSGASSRGGRTPGASGRGGSSGRKTSSGPLTSERWGRTYDFRRR